MTTETILDQPNCTTRIAQLLEASDDHYDAMIDQADTLATIAQETQDVRLARATGRMLNGLHQFWCGREDLADFLEGSPRRELPDA